MSDSMKFFVSCVILFLIIGVVAFLVAGPQGCSRHIRSWSSSAYGSDWLVVHYSQDGKVINYWELKNKSIGNEEKSDGINFIDNEGNVIHLSGHYVYVEIKNAKWNEAKTKFLK